MSGRHERDETERLRQEVKVLRPDCATRAIRPRHRRGSAGMSGEPYIVLKGGHERPWAIRCRSCPWAGCGYRSLREATGAYNAHLCPAPDSVAAA